MIDITTETIEAAREELRPTLAGEVLTPGDDGYDEARSIWNGVIDRKPAVIARVAGTEDVAAALRFASDRGLAVTVRGGGHGVAGNALSDGGLVVDLSTLKDIEVDPEGRTARAQAGVTLGELDAATQEHGLATPLGVVTKTGIAGLTLSGGIGWLRRKHGLAADNLVSLEVVTAAGDVITASESDNADLFWALRGGGGGFGVVTAFEYRLYPVGPDVFVAFVLYPGERAEEVIAFGDRYTREAPEEVSPLGILGHVPHADVFPQEWHGKPYAAFIAVHPGDPAEGERVLAPLRELGEPIADLSGMMPYTEAQAILDEDYPDGGRYYWKSADLEELGREVLGRLAAANASSASHHSTIDIWYHGGAMSRVAPEATAFGTRPAYLIGVESNWEDAADDDLNIAWARETVESLRPFSSGAAYLNFPGFFEEGEELLRASYGETNYKRLVAIKETYDPKGVLGPLGGVQARRALT